MISAHIRWSGAPIFLGLLQRQAVSGKSETDFRVVGGSVTGLVQCVMVYRPRCIMIRCDQYPYIYACFRSIMLEYNRNTENQVNITDLGILYCNMANHAVLGYNVTDYGVLELPGVRYNGVRKVMKTLKPF